jgi:hypothetical protein
MIGAIGAILIGATALPNPDGKFTICFFRQHIYGHRQPTLQFI